jgi:hypothetical protein
MGVAIVEPDTGRVTPTPEIPEDAHPSPDGTGASWLAEGALHWARWGEPPRTVSLPATPPNAGAWHTWLGDGRVLLVHQNAFEDLLSCFTLEPAAGAWEPAKHCPHGNFMELADLRAGPRGLYAVGSSGEGHPDVLVTRYTPERGQRDVPSPYRDLYPFGWVDVTFHPNGRTATLLTRCQLGDPDGRPCQGHQDDDHSWPLNAYQWTIGSPRATLQAWTSRPARSSIPPGPGTPGRTGTSSGYAAWTAKGSDSCPCPRPRSRRPSPPSPAHGPRWTPSCSAGKAG